MKQKYTFLSLLHDISKKEQPETVIYRKKTFTWSREKSTYIDEKGKDLMNFMGNYPGGSLCTLEMISAEKQILNEQEQAFLKIVLAPIRDRIHTITKQNTTGGCCYLDICFDEIPEFGEKDPGHVESWAFKRSDAFGGMIAGYGYLPEDLDL